MGHSDGTVRRHWAMHVRVIVPVPCARTYLWHLSHLAEQVLLRLHGGLARRRGKPSWMHGETKRKGGRTAGLDGRHHGQTGERADIGMGRAGGRNGTGGRPAGRPALDVLGSKANAPTQRVRAAPGNSVCHVERRVERRPFLAHPIVMC